MKFDLILGGVGGQGILTIAFVIDNAAVKQGYHVKQSELHGMAQRGGAVLSQLRLSKDPIFSDLIPMKGADMIISTEPMEVFRYGNYLNDSGVVISSTTPVVNISDYPDPALVLAELAGLPGIVLVDCGKVAGEAGGKRAANMVMLGAASPFLPLDDGLMEEFIRALFERKGDRVVATNIRAFRLGRANGSFFASCAGKGIGPRRVLDCMAHLESATLDPGSVGPWHRIMTSVRMTELERLWGEMESVRIPGDVDTAQRILSEGVAFLEG